MTNILWVFMGFWFGFICCAIFTMSKLADSERPRAPKSDAEHCLSKGAPHPPGE